MCMKRVLIACVCLSLCVPFVGLGRDAGAGTDDELRGAEAAE